MTKKRKIIVGAVLGGSILALSGIALASGNERGTLVRTEEVQRRDLVSVVTASGTVNPKRKVDISADISGRVIALAVEEGQWVDQGDLLLRIDPTAYEAAVRRADASVAQSRARAAQARANLIQARSAVRRAEQLGQGQDLISAADLEDARTRAAVAESEAEAARYGVAQAQAGLSEAREALRKTVIVAPMSGRVTRLNIDEGETAVVGTMNNPGSLLLTVADLSVMETTVKVDETDVPRITVGDSARVRIDAFPGRVFPGTVSRIANSAIQTASMGSSQDQQSVDFEVAITLADPPAELRPDLSATAEIITDFRGRALAVPIIALTVRDSLGRKPEAGASTEEAPPGTPAVPEREDTSREIEGVFVLQSDTAAFVPVTVGIAGDRYFEVQAGLKGGETVVAGSYQAIRDLESGQRIRTEKPKTAKGKASSR